jgi:hypothetical protein
MGHVFTTEGVLAWASEGRVKGEWGYELAQRDRTTDGGLSWHSPADSYLVGTKEREILRRKGGRIPLNRAFLGVTT